MIDISLEFFDIESHLFPSESINLLEYSRTYVTWYPFEVFHRILLVDDSIFLRFHEFLREEMPS